MNATCKNCDTTFHHMDRNEDGSPAIECTCCAHPGCEVYLCRAGCEHLSFVCGGCGERFCNDHRVDVGDHLCPGCALEAVESGEPECTCTQTDVDQFDAYGCEFHEPTSAWSRLLRVVAALREEVVPPRRPAPMIEIRPAGIECPPEAA
jgi:hypothetical protein